MANIDGFDLRERPWQPGLDDARFNQQPRNPNFTGGASPEAAAYQRANDLRGMAATERPWTGADTKAFGNRPAGVPPSVGERLKGAADVVRDGYARVVGDKAHFGPQPTNTPAPVVAPTQPAQGVLRRAGNTAAAAVGKASALGGVGYGAYQAARGVADGNYGDAALGAADAAASASLVTPAAPVGATWLGARAAHGVLKGAVDDPDTQDLIGGTINQIGLRTGLWGVDDSAYLQQKAEHNLRNPIPAATAAEKAAAPQAAAPQAPATQVVAQAPDGTVLPAAQAYGGQAGAPTNNLIVRDGNSYSGGIVGPNARIGDRQADGDVRLRDFGGGFVQGGSFAPVAAAAPVQAPVAEAPQVRHSGNDWAARNRLRNLEVSASSITNNGGRFDQHRGASPAARAYLEAARQDLALQGAQPGLDLETTKSNNALRGQEMGANASRYTADQNLRGEIFKATASVGNAHAQAQRDAEKYATDRRREATERLDKVLGSYATVDGKVDEGRLAALRNNAQAFIGTAIDAARKRGDEATARQLEREGLTALADDPSLMRKYAAAMKLDAAARRRNGGNYVGTDNPGARVVNGVTPRNMVGLGGEVVMSDGTRVPRNRVEYDPNSGILPNGLAHIDPWSNRTTEYDSIDPRGLLRKEAQ